MRLKEIFKLPAGIPKISWEARLKSEENSISSAVTYSFSYQIPDRKHFPTEAVNAIILQNPWAAINKYPQFDFVQEGTEDRKVTISFSVISEDKGRLIEEEILKFLKG